MSNALVVTAHPETASFNFALGQQAVLVLQKQNWQVTTSSLYQMDYDARMGPNDYPALPAEQDGTLMQKQQYAFEQNLLVDDITTEQNKLKQADLLILQFPIWWGSYPAILKGWIERVCCYGFAYGPQKQLAGKQVMLSVTTGGAANESECQYYLDKVTTMANEVFGYMGMDIVEPHLVHGPAALSKTGRVQSLENHQKHLQRQIDSVALELAG